MALALLETDILSRVGYVNGDSAPGVVYSLPTQSREIDGKRTHEILERTSVHVLRGIGALADGRGPERVVFEIDKLPTKKASRRLGNAGLRLFPGDHCGVSL